MATLSLIVAWGLPFVVDVQIGALVALLIFPAIYAFGVGLPRAPLFAYSWVAILVGSICALIASFVLFLVTDLPPGNFALAFHFERRGSLDVFIMLIVILSMKRAQSDGDEENKKEDLARYREAYNLFMDGDESSISGMDPASVGYPATTEEMCYFARPEVALGSFEEWNHEVSREIEGKLKLGVMDAGGKFGEKNSRVERTFVQQQPGVMLIFTNRVVFLSQQTTLTISARDISSILWSGWDLILTVKNEEKPLVFRVPPPVPPWVLGAAVTRAVRRNVAAPPPPLASPADCRKEDGS